LNIRFYISRRGAVSAEKIYKIFKKLNFRRQKFNSSATDERNATQR